jgi:hypothetical protein
MTDLKYIVRADISNPDFKDSSKCPVGMRDQKGYCVVDREKCNYVGNRDSGAGVSLCKYAKELSQIANKIGLPLNPLIPSYRPNP